MTSPTTLGVGLVIDRGSAYRRLVVERRRNLSQEVFEAPERRIFLLLQTKQDPSEQEWNGWYELLRQHSEAAQWDLERYSNIVVTDGGVPSLAQRTKINNLVNQAKRPPAVALVTTSSALRSVVSAFTIFNPRFKVFSPDDFPAVARFVGAPAAERALIAVFDRMEREELGSGAIETLKRIRRFAK